MASFSEDENVTAARFMEDGNEVEIEVVGQGTEFFSGTENEFDEESGETECSHSEESESENNEEVVMKNNNATHAGTSKVREVRVKDQVPVEQDGSVNNNFQFEQFVDFMEK